MKRHQDIGLAFAQLLLLLTFTGTIADTSNAMDARRTDIQRAEIHTTWRADRLLDAGPRLRWHEDEATDRTSVGPRCFTLDFATKGTWWIEVRSTRPATSPGLLVMDADGPHDPRMIERRETLAFRIVRPGEHIVCLTSLAPLGDVEVLTFVDKSDPLETEVDEDPKTFGVKSDPLETEVDEDP
ncbi:MAG: hypothetical protein GY856_44460 [bacterium]|nr:hypothetical protein [bacterium]